MLFSYRFRRAPAFQQARAAAFLVLAAWIFLAGKTASADVVSTVNIDGPQSNNNPSSHEYYLRYNLPTTPAEPFFRVNSATVHAIAGTSNLTYSLWGVVGGSSSQLGGNISSVTPTGNQDVITDLTGFGSFAYSSYDIFVLQITGVNAPYSTTNGAYTFTSSNANVASAGLYVGANDGTGTPAGSNNLWLNTDVAAVPEPGTLLLAGIASACGGTGVWWKRCKRQPQAASIELPAAD